MVDEPLMGDSDCRCANIACAKPAEHWTGYSWTARSLKTGQTIRFCSPACASNSVEWEQAHMSDTRYNSGKFLRGTMAGQR